MRHQLSILGEQLKASTNPADRLLGVNLLLILAFDRDRQSDRATLALRQLANTRIQDLQSRIAEFTPDRDRQIELK
jgi:hypothetical protein